MASLLSMRLSLLSPFSVSLSVEFSAEFGCSPHRGCRLDLIDINWCGLTAGKRRIVDDLVVQAAQRGKDLRLQVEVPAIPLVGRLNEPDCALQHQRRPESAQEDRPLMCDRLQAASSQRPGRAHSE